MNNNLMLTRQFLASLSNFVKLTLIVSLVILTTTQFDSGVSAVTANETSTVPQVDAGIDASIEEGEKFTLSATVDVLEPELTTAIINWGDGSPDDEVVPDADGKITTTHQYENDGDFSVSVSVAGLFGDQGEDIVEVSIQNLPPIIEPIPPLTADLADPIGVVLVPEVSDPGEDPLTFDWDLDGDGQFGDSSNRTVIISSPTVGVFFSSLRVQDDQGAVAEQSFEISVIDTRGNVSVPVVGPGTGDETAPVRLAFRAQNNGDNRSLRPGDRILLDVRVRYADENPTQIVDRVDFTLNEEPLPAESLVTQLSDTRWHAVLGRGVSVEGHSLDFVATAYDSNDIELAAETLRVNVLSGLHVIINQISHPATQARKITYFAQVSGNSSGPHQFNWTSDGPPVVSSPNSSYLVFEPDPNNPYPDHIEVSVVATDSLGSQGTAKITTTVLPSRNQPADTALNRRLNDSSEGKIQGRSIIGRLVTISSTEIVVNAKNGADFTDVRVHIDSATTETNADLDAEAFTRGSKVVVIADRDVLSGDSIALKIRAIPSESTRKHDRVLVSKPDDGNTVVLSGEDDSAEPTTITDNFGRYIPGDILVAIVRKKNSGNRGRNPSILVNTSDVSDRLRDYAQKRFKDGDVDVSGLIDRLEAKRREREQDRLEQAKNHRNEAVRRAAELAEQKAKRRAELEAADPVNAIRAQAVAASENNIVECASRLVGRPVRAESDLTESERRRVIAECDVIGGGERIFPDADDPEFRFTPPAEVLDCIRKVMGEVPDRPLTIQEEARVKQACAIPAGDSASEDETSDRRSRAAVDARKRAFCQANPSDSHCTSNSTRPPTDSTTEAEKRAFCDANPTDERCVSRTERSDEDSTSEAEKEAFCSANPDDPRCVREPEEDDSNAKTDSKSATPSGTK